MAQSIFERCGGFSTVRKITSQFYDRVLDSPRLQKHFANTDMRLLIDHQTKFVASLMGGPVAFSDDVLRRVHEHLGITKDEFLEMAELLCDTLEEFDLDKSEIELVHREIIKRELLIVTR